MAGSCKLFQHQNIDKTSHNSAPSTCKHAGTRWACSARRSWTTQSQSARMIDHTSKMIRKLKSASVRHSTATQALSILTSQIQLDDDDDDAERRFLIRSVKVKVKVQVQVCACGSAELGPDLAHGHGTVVTRRCLAHSQAVRSQTKTFFFFSLSHLFTSFFFSACLAPPPPSQFLHDPNEASKMNNCSPAQLPLDCLASVCVCCSKFIYII